MDGKSITKGDDSGELEAVPGVFALTGSAQGEPGGSVAQEESWLEVPWERCRTIAGAGRLSVIQSSERFLRHHCANL